MRCIFDSSGKEKGGEEAEGMAEAEAVSESEMMMSGHELASDAADTTLHAESDRDHKRRRVSTNVALNDFLDSATLEQIGIYTFFNGMIGNKHTLISTTNITTYRTVKGFFRFLFGF